MRQWIAFTLFACTLGLGRGAAAQQADADALRFGFHFGLGVGGESETTIDTPLGSGTVDSDLDPSLALGFRLDAPSWKYLALGALFQVDFPQADGADDRAARLAFDLLVRPRYVVDTSAGPLDLYVLVPIGFSLGFPRDAIPGVDTGVGWNIGVLGGAQFLVHPRVGILFELGWMRHDTRHDDDVDNTDKTQIVTNQAILNFGVVVPL